MEEEIKPRISVNQWVGLPDSVRTRLHEKFSLHKSVGCHLDGGILLSDGHSFEDLGVITLDKMNAYLKGNEKDFYTAFNACIEKAKQPEPIELEKPVEAIVEPPKAIVEDYIPPKPTVEALANRDAKKRGRPAKQ